MNFGINRGKEKSTRQEIYSWNLLNFSKNLMATDRKTNLRILSTDHWDKSQIFQSVAEKIADSANRLQKLPISSIECSKKN